MAMCNYLFTSLLTSTLGGTIAFHLPNLFMSSRFLQFQANKTIPKKVLEITCNCSQLVFQGNSHSSPSYSWPSHAFMLIISYSDVIEYIRFITVSTISKKFWKISTPHLPDLVVSSTKEHKKGMARALKLSTNWCKLRSHKSTRRCCSDCRCRSWLISCITCVLAPHPNNTFPHLLSMLYLSPKSCCLSKIGLAEDYMLGFFWFSFRSLRGS
jgi:hypothetical protein